MEARIRAREAADDFGEGEAILRRAIDVTREQGSLTYELDASTDLASLLASTARIDEGRRLLSAVCARFTEGLEALLVRVWALYLLLLDFLLRCLFGDS